MKKVISLVVAVAVFAFVGCSSKSEKKATVNTPTGTFTLKAPDDVTLDQGGSKEITVSISRDNYNDDVKLDFSQMEGVKIEGDKTIEKGTDNAKLTLTAEPTAKKAENQVIEVKGTGTGNASKTVKFKVTVKEKKKEGGTDKSNK
jgi:hypothetical protein